MIRNKQFITKSEDGVIKTLIHPLKVNVLVRTLALEWRLKIHVVVILIGTEHFIRMNQQQQQKIHIFMRNK